MVVTDGQLNLIKEDITKLIIAITNINSEENSKRRNSEDITVARRQKEIDYNNLFVIRNKSLEIFDECNKMFI